MSREKVSISLDKDEKSLRTFNLQHMVKALPLTSWHLTNFLETLHRLDSQSCLINFDGMFGLVLMHCLTNQSQLTTYGSLFFV